MVYYFPNMTYSEISIIYDLSNDFLLKFLYYNYFFYI